LRGYARSLARADFDCGHAQRQARVMSEADGAFDWRGASHGRSGARDEGRDCAPGEYPYTPATRSISEWIADGAIGRVREVHNWSSRPYWPQGVDRPKESQTPPQNLNWDLWVGPAPMRPYNKAYLPFVWRGWY